MNIVQLIKKVVERHKSMKNRPILYIKKADGSQRLYKLYLTRVGSYRNREVSIYTPYNSVYCGEITYSKFVGLKDMYKVYYPSDEKYKDIYVKFLENNTIGHCKVGGRSLMERIVYRISDNINFNI